MRKQKKRLIVLIISIFIVISIFFLSNYKLQTSYQLNGLTENLKAGSSTSIDVSKWDTNKVTPFYDSAGNVAPIPKGYVASGATGENLIQTGLVIYEGTTAVTSSNAYSESKTRNQWVWVPVPDTSRVYTTVNGVKKARLWTYTETERITFTNTADREPSFVTNYDNEQFFSRYELQRFTREKFYQELQMEYEETMNSIEKYGGFYIGRYETGDMNQKVPVIKRLNTNYGGQTWYSMYNKVPGLVKNTNLKANLIWGSLWDETLQWFIDSGARTLYEVGVNSVTWSNCTKATFTYTTADGKSATKSNSSFGIPTGSTEYTKTNNIYDMSGNADDFTLENYNPGHYQTRGGSWMRRWIF